MEKGRKIRNLIEKDHIHVNLNDIIDLTVQLSHPLFDLEYGNNKTDLKKAKKIVSELEKHTKALGQRIRGEVFDEVHSYAKIKNANYTGDPERFKKSK